MSSDVRDSWPRLPFDCPVTWCVGEDAEHREGGPDQWLHQAEYETLPGVDGGGYFAREGSGPMLYAFAVHAEGEHTSAQLRERAAGLRALAVVLERRAGTLDAGGIR
jgi:hypothetical protein